MRMQSANRSQSSRFVRRLAAGFEMLETRTTPASLPTGFSDHLVDDGLDSPVAFARAPDGRFFIAEQGGDLRIVENGNLLHTPFVSLNVNSDGERGLLGVAFDPNFAANNYIYVYYTVASSPIHNRVSRFTADGNQALANSEVVLLDLNNLSSATNHNGGAIHFGPDGKLYIAVGDNANGANSQSLGTVLGKILRINPDPNDLIPNDNPFVGQTTGINRAIWALGLRNPFSFAFNQNTDSLYINDVGQSTWEEINEGAAGANYGWPTTEGPTNNPNFTGPIFAYQHNTGQPRGNAITGGTFYDAHNPQFPRSYLNDYFFADFTAGWIWKYDQATDSARRFADLGANFQPIDLLTAPGGSLYYLTRNGNSNTGELHRITYDSQPPQILQFGDDVVYPAGSSNGVQLTSTAVVRDPDSVSFQGGRLRVKLTTGTAAPDELYIQPNANFTLTGRQVRYRGTVVGRVGGGTDGVALVVRFNANATAAIVRGVLRSVRFRSLAFSNFEMRTVVANLTDGDGAISQRVSKQIRILPPPPDAPTQQAAVATSNDANDQALLGLNATDRESDLELLPWLDNQDSAEME